MLMSGIGYRCSGGETFDSIALEVYGSGRYAADLMCANPALCGKLFFDGGETVALPVVENTAINTGDGSYAPAAAPWRDA